MKPEQILTIGSQRLAEIEQGAEAIQAWRACLTSYQLRAEYPDNAHAWLTCPVQMLKIITEVLPVSGLSLSK